MSDSLPFACSPTGPRTIALWGSVAPPSRGEPPAWLPLRWPDMPAGATLDYTLDATALLANIADTLSATVNNVTNVVLQSQLVTAGLVTFWLISSTPDCDALVDVTLTTVSTRRVHRIVRLRVT